MGHPSIGVDERFPRAPAKPRAASGDYDDILWEALLGEGWNPEQQKESLNLNELADNDPRAREILQKIRERWDSAPVNPKLDNRRVRIPGFAVPLDGEKDRAREFLLVPYFGACIHAPVPPANQVIHVGARMKKEMKPTPTSRRRSPPAAARRKGKSERAGAQAKRKSDGAVLTTSRPQGGGVAAVDRALEILGAFGPGDQALTLAELAQRTKFYKSTILRIAQSLLRHNYLQRLDDGSYRIGPAPLMLGALYQRSLRLGDILLPLMHQLAEQTGESVSVYSRNGDVRVCIHRVDSKHAVRDHVREGDVLPLDRGSGGRILLAFSGARGEPYETIRNEYCYASVGERDAETAGVSVPLFGSGQVMLGALTLSGPRSRMDETFIANARALLLRAAARATNSLGGDASRFDAALALTLAGKREAPASRKRDARA